MENRAHVNVQLLQTFNLTFSRVQTLNHAISFELLNDVDEMLYCVHCSDKQQTENN